MRIASMLIILVCSLTASAVPEISIATQPADAVVAGATDEADYQALQNEADLALAMLVQAHGQRIAALAIN